MKNFNFLLNQSGITPEVGRKQLRPDSVSKASRIRVLSILLVFLTLGVGNAWGDEYKLITSTSDLNSSSKYIIATGSSGSVYVMDKTTESQYRHITSSTVSVSSSKITTTSDMLILTLGGSSGAWTFYTDNYATNGYLNTGSTTTKNYLYVNTNNDKYKYFTISFSSNAAVITCTGKDSHNIMRFNSDRITCYSSGQSPVYLYRKCFSITYDCDGASSGCPSNTTGQFKLPNPLPSAPTKDGYTFAGWYTNSTKTTAAVAGATLTGNTTLYAKWEAVVVTCDAPTGLSNGAHQDATTGNNGSQVVSWSGSAANYDVCVNASNHVPTPGTSPDHTGSATSYTISGKTPGTYRWWVRSNCGELKSDWIEGTSFTIKGVKTGGTIPVQFGIVAQGSSVTPKTINVTGIGLESGTDITASFPDGSPFSVSSTSVNYNASSEPLTISASTATVGAYDQNLTLSYGGEYTATVRVTMTVVAADRFIDVLQNTSGYEEATPHIETGSYSTPSLTDKSAATSGTCEEQHWHFMGWITKAKYDAGTTILDGDLQTPTTASNATYYAVWAKGSAGSSGSFTISASDITSGPASYSTTETKFTKLATNDIGYKNVSYNNANTPSNWAAQTRIQFKKDATNYGELYNLVAISGLTKIRIYEESNCASVLTIYTGTTSKATTSTLSWPGSATGTESLSISKSGGGTISFTSNYYDLNVSSGHTFFYIKNANSSVAYPIKIVVYYSTVTYSDYKASCCANLITIAAPTITGSGCSITFDKSSPVETCSSAKDVVATVSVTNGYKVTELSFTVDAGTVGISPAIAVPYTSSQDFTLSFSQNHAAATLTTTATVVALQDKYYDYMHDNALKHTKSGNYGTAPTLDSKSVATEAGCMDNHYKFIGWVISTDVNDDGSLKGGYTLIPGGATGKYATGATYIAVWAEEE